MDKRLGPTAVLQLYRPRWVCGPPEGHTNQIDRLRSSASAKMPIGHPIRWDPTAHRTGCLIGTDGRRMGISARLHRAPSGTIGGGHETGQTDSFFMTNQQREMLRWLQDSSRPY